ncbi:MAG: IS200/IS605 family transposase [Bacteroidota bacterium]
MPYIKVMIHFVWSTKNRKPLISKSLKPLLLEHIKENAKSKAIFIDKINCVEDHIHLLVSMGNEQTISKIVMLIKGESSFWVNKQKLVNEKFEWQDEYFAVSVNESAIDNVRKYIDNQEEHHRVKTFKEEYDEFIKVYGFKKE